MAPVPLFKLGALILRTLAKPVAARLMVDAKNHPAVAKLCMICGEAVHQITSRVYILAQGYRVVGINPLPKEEALNSGVTIVSEIIVFFVAGTILVYEYKVSEESNAAKSAAAAKVQRETKQELDDRFEVLDTKLLVLAERIQELEKQAAARQSGGAGGVIPFEWMFGTITQSANGTMVLSKGPSGPGKLTENLPSTLEDDEIFDANTSPSTANGSNSSASASSRSSAAVSLPGGDASTGGAAQPRTWVDWLLWR